MKIKSTLLFLMVLFGLSAFATNHNITFANYSYTPANTTVAVGDTITWLGDLSTHPLSTTAVPSGATAIIHVNIGTSYSYKVLIPGSYSYQCDSHFSLGMVGTFTATGVSSVEEVTARPTLSFKLTMLAGMLRISDQNDAKDGSYQVHIGNILGESVYNGTMSSYEQEKIIDIQDRPKGVYLLAITDDNRQTFVRKFMIQ